MPLTLPEGLENARTLCRSVIAEALAPDPELLVSDWADQHRKLSSKASAEAGEWRTARTPYLREIMNAMSPSHPSTDGDFMKGTQIGGSEALYNAIGFTIDQVPCPSMLVMPTVDTAQLVSKQRLQPMFDATPSLSQKIGEQKSRASSNTTLRKDYPGGLLLIRGANSGPGLRSAPVRFLAMDEVDAYPDDVDGEGDPCAVAEKRTEQFGARAKRFACSSPKIKGKSRIERRYVRGTRGRYYVPCPHCAHEQVLRWAQIRWEMEQARELACASCGAVNELHDAAPPAACPHCAAPLSADAVRARATDDVAEAWYECDGCGARIDEHYKTVMLERGRWIHEAPGVGEVLADDDPHPHAILARLGGLVRRFLPRFRRPLSWQLSALYSPLGWFSWRKAVGQWIEANKGGYNEETGESLLQVFYNTVLGETFDVQGEQPEFNLLKQRVEGYALGQVPAGGLLLTAFCDVQGDRLEVEVDAFGRGEECWLVDHQVIHGDPAKHGPGSVWEALASLRDKAYAHAGGQTVRIWAMGVDSGYLTQDVYDHCRTWVHKQVIATKGEGGGGKPVLGRPTWVDVSHKGKKIKRGVQLWHIGTDSAKERLYRRLDLERPEGAGVSDALPGYQHFPRGLPDEYFEQLTAEKLVRRRVRGIEKHEWVKTRERNEALDLKIGCYAVAIYAGLQRVNWDQLERVINPQQQDLFAAQKAAPPAVTGAAGDAVATVSGAAAADAPAASPVQTSAPRGGGWLPRRENWLTARR